MVKFLKNLFKKAKPSTKYDGKRWDFSKGCPDCGETSIYEGPSGGMCQNVCCANPFCRSAFNHMGVANFVERIPNTHFRSAFPECPEESEAYLATIFVKDLNKETDTFIEKLDESFS